MHGERDVGDGVGEAEALRDVVDLDAHVGKVRPP
jgi:hypothetical protein